MQIRLKKYNFLNKILHEDTFDLDKLNIHSTKMSIIEHT